MGQLIWEPEFFAQYEFNPTSMTIAIDTHQSSIDTIGGSAAVQTDNIFALFIQQLRQAASS